MKELKSWGDLAKRYDLVLFNNMIELEDGAVFNEYLDNTPAPEEGEAGEYPNEVFQWYLIGSVNENDVEWLNKEFDLEIFYSDTLGNYVLPVYHFGTSWDILGLKGGYINE